MDVVLQFSALSKTFSGQPALLGINTHVAPGDVVGLLGVNGAGKTTLMDIALGFLPGDDGEVRLYGHDPLQLPLTVKHRIGYVPQQDELLPHLSADAYLAMIGRFYSQWHASELFQLAADWGLPLYKKMRELSVGQRQKIAILAALGHHPDFLVLDEPVSSLDPLARRQFLQTLIEHCSARACTILFSTHIVSDLERLASRVWMLKGGRLVADLPLDTVKEKLFRVCFPAANSELLQLVPGKTLRKHLLDGEHRLLQETCSDALHEFAAQYPSLMMRVESLSLEEWFLEMQG